MKKLLILFVLISFCGGTSESVSEQEVSGNSTLQSSTSTTINQVDFKKLDEQYRKNDKFILPTFNGNCPHQLDEIIELFDYWK